MTKRLSTPETRQYRRQLLERMAYELVPMKSAEQAIADLPPASTVSVTCSPVKGIDATMALTDQLRARGHQPIPHLAARLVESPDHAQRIAKWIRTEDIGTLYVIGGDDPKPVGPYDEAFTFLRDLLEADPGVHTIGIAGYPDGHPLIGSAVLDDVLLRKQALLTDAGVHGYVSTQMCFDPHTIISWLETERTRGVTFPVHLGIPGVINQTKLLTMGVRLGIGASLRYLRKNRSSVTRMLAPGGYDPNQVLDPLEPHLERLGIDGIHCFTFNQVEPTRVWAQASIEDLRRGVNLG